MSVEHKRWNVGSSQTVLRGIGSFLYIDFEQEKIVTFNSGQTDLILLSQEDTLK